MTQSYLQNVQLFFNLPKTKTLIACGLLGLCFTGLANANLQAKSDQLKTCITNSVELEREKETPSAQAVLAKCANEITALTATLTPEGVAKVRQNLNAGIAQALSDQQQ